VEKTQHTFLINDTELFYNKMLNWVNQFNIFCLLDSNQYVDEESRFDWLLAAGSTNHLPLDFPLDFQQLQAYHQQHKSWLFGHFSYPSKNADAIGFPAAFFFNPQIIIQLKGSTLLIEANHPQKIFEDIQAHSDDLKSSIQSTVNIQQTQSKADYLQCINAIKQHIQRGDCYEINYCQAFNANDAVVDPLYLYRRLKAISPNPFGALYKLNDKYCICASPERFIKKSGKEIISQPIKGTSKRNRENIEADEQLKHDLLHSPKERSENVMIVDLVRNDLSKICNEGTVHVKELFGIYSFPHVHQMISTIAGEVSTDIPFTSIIEACYPMGSMTGAPKKKVMELIEKYEIEPRGIFSGSIGYITPEEDFDFNVVIRSIYYNATTQTLSYKAGGGITINSNPEEEYEELLLKASAIENVLKL